MIAALLAWAAAHALELGAAAALFTAVSTGEQAATRAIELERAIERPAITAPVSPPPSADHPAE